MAYDIKINAFEGPLDVLLHLIRKNEMNIYDIQIAEITDQYMEYLKGMEEMDLNIASEFLVMAATLLEIKSQMLLPKKKAAEDEEEDMDPRKELVEKLVEYQKYKEFAQQLKDSGEDKIIFFKPPEIVDDIEDEEIFFKNITLENLMHAYKKIIRIYENKFNGRAEIPENISFDEYRIEDKMNQIQNALKNNRRISFEEFFKHAESKMEIVVIFLAMLELIKQKLIKVLQYENFGDITIEGQDGIWKIS